MRRFVTWSAPLPGGGNAEETALTFDEARSKRVLVIPPLFDEANKLRRQIAEIMHRLDLSGIDSFLPDFPGCNESIQPLEVQTLEDWQFAAETAMHHFKATHVLTVRCGALLAPSDLPGWRYAPTGGQQILRSMLRARTISAREAGHDETIDALTETGRNEGIVLAGWQLGADLFGKLVNAKTPAPDGLADITQGTIGGAGLWLRAEPDEDPEQADALAALVAMGMLDQ